ncbi:unnamed protein product, partial [marine sediment metagenome]
GWMPTLKEMIDQEGYKISRVDCGTPATTPACQAGILLGNNHDIPAFRWFDKDQNRLMVGNNVAEEIEPHLSNGLGLVRDGSSIGNIFSGDARKSILTFSKLRTGSEEDKKNRADDIYLLMMNPYFFMRTLVLFFADDRSRIHRIDTDARYDPSRHQQRDDIYNPQDDESVD